MEQNENIVSSIHEETGIDEKMEIINQRMAKYPNNSPIWWCSDFYEVDNSGEFRRDKLWQIDKILDNRKDNSKKCQYTNNFKNLNSGNYYLKCIICGEKKIFYTSSTSCSDMHQHLIIKHANVLKDYKKIEKGEYCSYSRNKNNEEINCHILLTSSIISSFSSFSLVENEEFKLFLKKLQPDYIPPSSTTISQKIIPDMYEEVINKIKKEIEMCEGLCLSIDGWTCNYTLIKYFSMTAHMIIDRRLISRVLKLEPFYQKATAENISEFIKKGINEFGLTKFEKLLILSDNAPDVMSGISLSGNINLGCVCHRIDNLMEYVIENTNVFEKLVRKCKNITNKFKNTPELKNILIKIQEETRGSPLTVIGDVPSRWSTEIDLVSRIMEIYEETNGIVEAKAELIENKDFKKSYLEDYYLEGIEINMLKFFLLCFKKLYSESMILSSDSECTLSLVIPTIRSLIAFFNNEKEKLLDLNIEYEYNEVTIIDNDNNQCFRYFSDFEEGTKFSRHFQRKCLLN